MDLDQTMKSYIHSYSLNERVRYALTEGHNIEFGVRSELFRVKSAEWTLNAVKEREVRSLWENSAWIDYAGSFGPRFDVSAGVRFTLLSAMSGDRFHDFMTSVDAANQFDGKTYFEVEPRISLKYNITTLHNVKAGFGIATQGLHAIRSSATSFPFDRYALTSAVVKPERALQYLSLIHI